jgi:uncharacterized membrane protein YhiD involved in acid resistance
MPILLALFVSFAMGLVIYFVYTRSFRGVVYSQNFAISLALMSTLSAMVTLAISSNIALSLGMVGALSIVRYRAAIKDPLDIMFIFWAVTSGITIGANMHYLAFVGSLIVLLGLIVIRKFKPDSLKYILLVHYAGEDIDDEIRRLLYKQQYKIKSKTVRKGDVEMAVEIVVKNDNLVFLDSLNQLPGVNDVTLVQYNQEAHS